MSLRACGSTPLCRSSSSRRRQRRERPPREWSALGLWPGTFCKQQRHARGRIMQSEQTRMDTRIIEGTRSNTGLVFSNPSGFCLSASLFLSVSVSFSLSVCLFVSVSVSVSLSPSLSLSLSLSLSSRNVKTTVCQGPVVEIISNRNN